MFRVTLLFVNPYHFVLYFEIFYNRASENVYEYASARM